MLHAPRAGMIRVLCSSLLVLAAACGGGGGADDGGDDTGTPDAPGGEPDANNEGWTRLIGRTWTVPAGSLDVYRCIRTQVTEDVYVSGFRSQAPLGSHHAVLTMDNSPDGPIGEYDCGVNTLDLQMLYASGVGTADLTFPTDVGIRIPAGTYIHLNLHLFNAGDETITGDSAVLVRTLPAAPPTLADMSFAGDMQLAIPGDNQPHVERGGCTVNQAFTVTAWWPHMHQLATHQKLTVTRDGTPMVILDQAYSFSEQAYYTNNTPFQFESGDRVEVECTYINPGPGTVNWGDSSNAEMCFTGWYRYPAAGNLFSCVSFF